MKYNQSGPGFGLVSPCPYPATITITPLIPFYVQIKMAEPVLPFSQYSGETIISGCFKFKNKISTVGFIVGVY